MAFRLAVQAEISLPAIFGDNMVLQQNTEVKIWGTSDSRAGISVTCSWDNRTYETTADASGKWSAVIETPPAGGPYRITVVDMAGDKVPILMGCGGNNTAEVVAELKTGDFSGIDGILSVCPYYNKPSQEGLYQHFKAIAAATSMPVVLYNVPGRTGVNMKAETTLRLARDCSNIVGIKEAAGSLEQVDDIIKNKPAGFDVISGDDALTFPMVACGAAGVISVIGNALPKEFSRMIRLEMNGEIESARKIHHKFTDLFNLLFVDGNPAGVKAMLSEMGMIENVLRLPLVPTRLTTMQRISECLKFRL